MYVLLPMDSADVQEALLTKIDEVKVWAQVFIEHGKVSEIFHSSESDGFENFSEAIVVVNDKEQVGDFMELSMTVLVANTQRSIDDIVEAYLFRELHDFPY